MKASNKVIVVTGAGSGMGRELTVQLVKKGAKVAMVDINSEGMAETAKLAGEGSCSSHVVDISSKEAVTALVGDVIKAHGTVDGIINNAGIIQPFIPVNELGYDKIERIMNINFYGTLYMTKEFLPELLKKNEGHVVNISSMGGFIPFPGQTFYGASKAAVKLLTEGLYAELKDTNVHVTVVHPGAVNTNITANSGVQSKAEADASKEEQAKMAMSAEAAAATIIKGMEENKFRVLVGKDASFLDKFYRFNPRKAVHFIVKKMSAMTQAGH